MLLLLWRQAAGQGPQTVLLHDKLTNSSAGEVRLTVSGGSPAISGLPHTEGAPLQPGLEPHHSTCYQLLNWHPVFSAPLHCCFDGAANGRVQDWYLFGAVPPKDLFELLFILLSKPTCQLLQGTARTAASAA